MIHSKKMSAQNTAPSSALAPLFWLLLAGLLFACSSTPVPHSFEVIRERTANNVVLSAHAPHQEYLCQSLGFLPCSLGDGESTPKEGRESWQCAHNLLNYLDQMGANYLFVETPLRVFGITWRDSKANLYRCQYLPQPTGTPYR